MAGRGRGRSDNKGKRIVCWIYEEDYKKAQALLAEHKISFSEFVRAQINQFVALEGRGHIINRNPVGEYQTFLAPDGGRLHGGYKEKVEEVVEEKKEERGQQEKDSYLTVFSDDDLYG